MQIRNNSSSCPQWRASEIAWDENNLLNKPSSCSRQDNAMTLSTEQLKRTALRGMFLQKVPEERQACPLHFSPDWQHTPEEPRRRTRTLIQSDTPDLSWAARLAHRASTPCPAEKAKQCHAGSAMAAYLCPPPPYCHLKSWQGQCLGQREDSHSIWKALDHKTRVC